VFGDQLWAQGHPGVGGGVLLLLHHGASLAALVRSRVHITAVQSCRGDDFLFVETTPRLMKWKR